MNNKAICTGAGGFIGSHLTKHLLEAGWEVEAYDKKPLEDWCLPHPKWDWGDRATTSHGWFDITKVDVDLWAEDRPDPVTVFHLAAIPRIGPSFKVGAPAEYANSNVIGTLKMLEFCRRTGSSMVYAGSSTCNTPGSPVSSYYALTKWMGERCCGMHAERFGVDTKRVRIYNAYGYGQPETPPQGTLIGIYEKALREGTPFEYTGDGLQRRDFTHVSDVVSRMIWVAEKDDGEYNVLYHIGNGDNCSVLDIARRFSGGDVDRVARIPSRPGEVRQTKSIAGPSTIGMPKQTVFLEDYINERIEEQAQRVACTVGS